MQQPAPKMIKNQPKRIIKGATKIYKQLVPSGGEKVIVMDDETYVPADPSQIPGKHYYSIKPNQNLPDSAKFSQKTKFPTSYMVWQAIDQDGNISKPFITDLKINGEIYQKECLKKRLLPFINKHHDINKVLFWPDMASVHYSASNINWLTSENISFVKKKDNTPNFPQGRPIELFWALCKKEYSKLKNKPKDIKEFRRKWQVISERVAERSGKNIMSGLKTKLQSVRKHGPLGPIKIKLPLRNITANNIQQ